MHRRRFTLVQAHTHTRNRPMREAWVAHPHTKSRYSRGTNTDTLLCGSWKRFLHTFFQCGAFAPLVSLARSRWTSWRAAPHCGPHCIQVPHIGLDIEQHKIHVWFPGVPAACIAESRAAQRRAQHERAAQAAAPRSVGAAWRPRHGDGLLEDLESFHTAGPSVAIADYDTFNVVYSYSSIADDTASQLRHRRQQIAPPTAPTLLVRSLGAKAPPTTLFVRPTAPLVRPRARMTTPRTPARPPPWTPSNLPRNLQDRPVCERP